MNCIKEFNEIKNSGKSKQCLKLIDDTILNRELKNIDLELEVEMKRSALQIKQDLMLWEDIAKDLGDLLD